MIQIMLRDLRGAPGVAAVDVDDAVLDRYSHDAWPVSVLDAKAGRHPFRPDAVVRVRDVEGVLETLRMARAAGVPVTARGLGSSVTGQALPTAGGIVLDLSGLDGADPRLDEMDRTVTAPAGMRGSDLEDWLRARGYTHCFFPQSLDRSTIGGWVATRATGQLSSRYGGIEDAAVGFTVALADGTIVRLGQRPRASTGPDLRHLFLGSEGTLGIVLDVTLRVFPADRHIRSEAWSLPTLTAGVEALRLISQAGIRPSLMRLYDVAEARHVLPGADAPLLFLTHEGLERIAAAEHESSTGIVAGLGGRSLGPAPVEAWYGRRFDFSTVEGLLASPGGYAETIEVAHTWSGIQGLYDALTSRLTPLADEVLGHFSHVYPNGVSLYVIVLGTAPSDAEASRLLADIWRTAMTATLEAGGELSHHHGAGLARAEYLAESLGSQHALLRRVKSALDPDGLLNPGHLGLH